jgi:hypothetical protein
MVITVVVVVIIIIIIIIIDARDSLNYIQIVCWLGFSG